MIYSDSTSVKEILNRIINGVDPETNEKFIPDTVDKREGSVVYTMAAPVALALYEMYAMMDTVLDSTFVDTQSLYFMIYRAKERGVEYKEPTAAQMVGRFVPDGVVQTGDTFMANNVDYVVDGSTPIATANGKEWWVLIAQTRGEAGNATNGDALTPRSKISGLTGAVIDTVTYPDQIVNGEEGDTAETLRARYYDAVDNVAFGGNRADYKEKVLAQEGVGAVHISTEENGIINVYILGEDGAAASDEVVAAVQEAIDPVDQTGNGYGIAPIGHKVTIHKATAFTVNVSATVTYKAGQSTSGDILKEAVGEYIDNLALEFADGDVSPVRPAGVEFAMIETGVLKDISSVKVNGSGDPVNVPEFAVPVLGTVTLTEA